MLPNTSVTFYDLKGGEHGPYPCIVAPVTRGAIQGDLANDRRTAHTLHFIPALIESTPVVHAKWRAQFALAGVDYDSIVSGEPDVWVAPGGRWRGTVIEVSAT